MRRSYAQLAVDGAVTRLLALAVGHVARGLGLADARQPIAAKEGVEMLEARADLTHLAALRRLVELPEVC
jgi:hypothetical protein